MAIEHTQEMEWELEKRARNKAFSPHMTLLKSVLSYIKYT